MIPYVAGISEDVRHICRELGSRVVFKFGCALRSILTKMNDDLPLNGEEIYGCPQDSLQMWQVLHWRDEETT